MKKKCGQTRQKTHNLRDELIWGMNSASELATVYYKTRRSIKGGSHSPPPGDKALCIIALSKDLFVVMSLIGSTPFGFAQNTMHDFQSTVLNP